MADLLTDGVTLQLLGFYLRATYGYGPRESEELIRRHLPAVQSWLAQEATATPYGRLASLIVCREKDELMSSDGLD